MVCVHTLIVKVVDQYGHSCSLLYAYAPFIRFRLLLLLLFVSSFNISCTTRLMQWAMRTDYEYILRINKVIS